MILVWHGKTDSLGNYLQLQRDYEAPFNSIPGHGRHQHFCVGGRDRISHLLATFPEDVDNMEKCRRMIDLFLVSVLLDAGAGLQWSYKSAENGRMYRRSEGLAVASLEMFKTVCFCAPRPLVALSAGYSALDSEFCILEPT